MNDIFSEAKSQAEKLLTLLIEGEGLLPERLVPKELLKQGYTLYKGFTVPTASVSHKYLFDDYEAPFLAAYIELFRKLVEECTNVTNEFSFRTLLEIGSENSLTSNDERLFPQIFQELAVKILLAMAADTLTIF